MFKKPLSSLQHLRPQQLTHVFAKELDCRLNQGALFILEQLVSGSESLTQHALKRSALVLPLSRSIRRKLKRRYFRFRYRYLPQQKLEAVLASLANPQLELNPRAIDLALQALCLAIMQGIITNTEHSILYLREAYIGLLEFWHEAIDWQMHRQGMKQVWHHSQRFVEQQCHQWQETIRNTMEMPRVQYLYALAKPLTKPSIYASILTLVVMSATSNADVADEMKVLIEQKKAGEAYVLGSKHPELMGDPLFDYF